MLVCFSAAYHGCNDLWHCYLIATLPHRIRPSALPLRNIGVYTACTAAETDPWTLVPCAHDPATDEIFANAVIYTGLASSAHCERAGPCVHPVKSRHDATSDGVMWEHTSMALAS